MPDTEQNDLTTLTVDLLSAYFANNSIDSGLLAGLIKSTHDALKELNAPAPVEEAAPHYTPAVSVRKSLASPDHILSLIDGKPYKTLKRHLGTHGLTPAEYRERYKLPRDYPLVAVSYSDQRRKVAEKLGLGRKVRTTAPAAAEAAPAAVTAAVVTPETSTRTAARAGKTGAASKTKVAAKAPVAEKSAPAKAKVARAPAVPSAAPAAAVVEAPTPVSTRKKPGRKPKIAAPAPLVEAEAPKPAAKRAPRKAKTTAAPTEG